MILSRERKEKKQLKIAIEIREDGQEWGWVQSKINYNINKYEWTSDSLKKILEKKWKKREKKFERRNS